MLRTSLDCAWMFAICCAIGLAGCGSEYPKIVPVSGQVLIDGAPLAQGFVRFVPTGSRASAGKLDSEGRFTLSCLEKGDGAVTGVHRVEIIASEVLSANSIKWHAPKKYSTTATSDLSYEISESTSDALVELSWDGGKPYIETLAGSGSSVEGISGLVGSMPDNE